MTWSKLVADFIGDNFTIAGKIFYIKRGDIPHTQLRFYTKNPRVHSVLNIDDEEPNQKDIQKELLSRDHVKDLTKQIERHKGLIEPIVVQDKTFEVLEGNCRLAAYRFLGANKENNNLPEMWKNMRCLVLPHDISEKYIFAYLGQVHIKGKTKWDPYEQAGYLSRMCDEGYQVEDLARDIGIGLARVERWVAVYQMMRKNEEPDNRKFSFYNVYLGNTHAMKARNEYSKLDDLIINEIQNTPFDSAQEFRKQLPAVCKDRTTLKNFVKEKHDLQDSYEHVESKGLTTTMGKKIRDFLHWIKDKDRKNLEEFKKTQLNNIEVDVKKIRDKMNGILKIIKDLKE